MSTLSKIEKSDYEDLKNLWALKAAATIIINWETKWPNAALPASHARNALILLIAKDLHELPGRPPDSCGNPDYDESAVEWSERNSIVKEFDP